MAYEAPNYTQTPNELLDDLLPQITSLSELKVTLAIIRNTFGWHREKKKLSHSYLVQATGLSREGVNKGIQQAIERGYVGRKQDGQSYVYWLNVEETTPEARAVDELSTLDGGVGPPHEVGQQPPHDVGTRKERNPKETERKEPGLFHTASLPKFKGKPVVPDYWNLTVQVLAEFNVQAGRNFDALTGSGELSESAKRIYSRIRDYSKLTFEDHQRIIRNCLANPWWEGPPTNTGVIYGPRVWEQSMVNDGKPTGKNAAKQQRSRERMKAVERITGRG